MKRKRTPYNPPRSLIERPFPWAVLLWPFLWVWGFIAERWHRRAFEDFPAPENAILDYTVWWNLPDDPFDPTEWGVDELQKKWRENGYNFR